MALGAFSTAFSSAYDIGSDTDTHDGGYGGATRREIEAIRRRMRELDRAREEDKKAAEQRLEAAIARAFREIGGEPEEAAAIVAAVMPEMVPETRPISEFRASGPPRIDFGGIASDLAAVERLVREMERRFIEEEEDIAVLVLALA